jgi:hypothetical protein
MFAVELSIGGTLWLADYSRVKIGFRRTKGNAEKIVSFFDKYFKKMRKVAEDNKDNVKGPAAHRI